MTTQSVQNVQYKNVEKTIMKTKPGKTHDSKFLEIHRQIYVVHSINFQTFLYMHLKLA